jgi:hypothetical protein
MLPMLASPLWSSIEDSEVPRIGLQVFSRVSNFEGLSAAGLVPVAGRGRDQRQHQHDRNLSVLDLDSVRAAAEHDARIALAAAAPKQLVSRCEHKPPIAWSATLITRHLRENAPLKIFFRSV